ncbi:branched-chain amino acid ABC transporter permease [Spirillospora sp. NPDC048911]|uniref:branched-chain amino acid ABC transporter permease n=1 Tax=Spirillospora sp. NPDC048911 TaxID=3364527 RepID=UPI00371943F4
MLGCVFLQTQLYTGQVRVVTAVFMFIVLAQSWNLIGGFTGYASFGQVVFFGLGGYTTAVLMSHAKWSFWPSMVVAGLVAAGFGALIGLPLLRLRGHYFAIATLGVAEGMRELVINAPDLTGGGAGITIPTFGADVPTPYPGVDGFYVIFLVLATVTVVVAALVTRGRFGMAMRAIHQDEEAAASMGINTTRTKVAAFALSGLFAGLAGSAYTFQLVTVYPDRMFDVEITVLMVIMVVIGGAGTILGPLLGAVGLQFLSEWLRQSFTEYHTFILGTIIILVVVLMPEGVVTYARDAWRTRDFSPLANVRRYRL